MGFDRRRAENPRNFSGNMPSMRRGTPAKEGKKRPLKTLERVLSKAGLGSRNQARRWIEEGRVCVDGKPVRDADRWVDLGRARVTLDGKLVRSARKRYILLYKPRGLITTYADPRGRPTVYSLLADVGAWVSPVGRLDLDTSGLLLLTNDTPLAERLTNPDYKVAKTYQVKAAGVLTEEQIEQLRRGVELKDGRTRPAEVRRLRDGTNHTVLEMTITEGRNRQVRRMIEAVGSKVLKLVRTGIGPLRIGDLRIGTWRELEPEEVKELRVAADAGREP